MPNCNRLRPTTPYKLIQSYIVLLSVFYTELKSTVTDIPENWLTLSVYCMYIYRTEILYPNVSHCTLLYIATVFHCSQLDNTVTTHWPSLYPLPHGTALYGVLTNTARYCYLQFTFELQITNCVLKNGLPSRQK